MIKVRNLTKGYNGEPCLRGISFDIKKGEFVSVMGESGSGKTTLLEILAGVRAPDGGSVVILGEDMLSLSEGRLSKLRRTKIGVVYQSFGLVPTLSARENIYLPMLLEHIPKAAADEKIMKMAKRLKIEGCLDKFPDELSGGQQQRVAIARAAVYGPELLLLDEPTGSLDSENTENVMRFLFEFSKESGATVLQITHSEKASLGTRILRIHDGTVI